MLWAETGSRVWESTVFCFALVFSEWMWLTEGEYWTEYVCFICFLCVHTLHLSQVAAVPPGFAVLHLRSNPSWNKEHMGALFKFPHCWLKLKLSPTSFLLSVFKHCPIPHPIPFECGTIPPEEAAPINLKISIRKKKRTTKTNRGWGERRRKTWNKVCVQWCQLCYGWQTLKCLIHSWWKHAATYCVDQTPCLNHRRKFMWL